MEYIIEEKPEWILTGYKKRFSGVPGERAEQEQEFYIHTRPLQHLLNGMSAHPETMYNVVANVGDDGFDFWIAQELTADMRRNIHGDFVPGENKVENLVIPAHTYAVFETERCQYPTTVFLNLRKRIVTEWLPGSGYRFSDAPELVQANWYEGARKKERYYGLWIPIEKAE